MKILILSSSQKRLWVTILSFIVFLVTFKDNDDDVIVPLCLGFSTQRIHSLTKQQQQQQQKTTHRIISSTFPIPITTTRTTTTTTTNLAAVFENPELSSFRKESLGPVIGDIVTISDSEEALKVLEYEIQKQAQQTQVLQEQLDELKQRQQIMNPPNGTSTTTTSTTTTTAAAAAVAIDKIKNENSSNGSNNSNKTVAAKRAISTSMSPEISNFIQEQTMRKAPGSTEDADGTEKKNDHNHNNNDDDGRIDTNESNGISYPWERNGVVNTTKNNISFLNSTSQAINRGKRIQQDFLREQAERLSTLQSNLNNYTDFSQTIKINNNNSNKRTIRTVNMTTTTTTKDVTEESLSATSSWLESSKALKTTNAPLPRGDEVAFQQAQTRQRAWAASQERAEQRFKAKWQETANFTAQSFETISSSSSSIMERLQAWKRAKIDSDDRGMDKERSIRTEAKEEKSPLASTMEKNSNVTEHSSAAPSQSTINATVSTTRQDTDHDVPKSFNVDTKDRYESWKAERQENVKELKLVKNSTSATKSTSKIPSIVKSEPVLETSNVANEEDVDDGIPENIDEETRARYKAWKAKQLDDVKEAKVVPDVTLAGKSPSSVPTNSPMSDSPRSDFAYSTKAASSIPFESRRRMDPEKIKNPDQTIIVTAVRNDGTQAPNYSSDFFSGAISAETPFQRNDISSNRMSKMPRPFFLQVPEDLYFLDIGESAMIQLAVDAADISTDSASVQDTYMSSTDQNQVVKTRGDWESGPYEYRITQDDVQSSKSWLGNLVDRVRQQTRQKPRRSDRFVDKKGRTLSSTPEFGIRRDMKTGTRTLRGQQERSRLRRYETIRANSSPSFLPLQYKKRSSRIRSDYPERRIYSEQRVGQERRPIRSRYMRRVDDDQGFEASSRSQFKRRIDYNADDVQQRRSQTRSPPDYRYEYDPTQPRSRMAPRRYPSPYNTRRRF